MKKILGLMILFFSLSSRSHSENEIQLNGGYEIWDENMPKNWLLHGDVAGKTEEAYRGTFAVKLNNWYEHLQGEIETGVKDSQGWEKPGFPIEQAPNLVSGYYKYVGKEECQSANADIVFYQVAKDNPKLHESIGTIHHELPPVSQYTSFEIMIPQNEIPTGTQRFSIRFRTQGRCESGTNQCCFLYLDEIQLVVAS